MGLKFNQRVKHGKLDFHPGVVYGFDDSDAEPYFTALGWADKTADAVQVQLTKGEIDIDPDTVFGTGPNLGKKVLEVANG